MMKQSLVCLAAAAFASAACAAVSPGENLLINGMLDAEQAEFPPFWNASSSRHAVYLRAGGPGGTKGAVVLRNDGGETRRGASVRQQGLKLVAGGTYKLSAQIRTRGFKSRNAGFIVHNSGWFNDVGLKGLPADSDWTRRERTFKLFASKDGEYGVAMFAVDLTGEIAFADVKLEAVSEDALAGSASQMALLATPRLIPIRPLLNRIPLAKPELVLRFHGAPPGGPGAYECLATVGGSNRIPQQIVPIESGEVRVSLAGLARGDHSLEAVVRHRETHAPLLEVSCPVTLVDVPAIDPGGARRLNNLVAELLNRPRADGPDPQTFHFVNPRDGWVYVVLAESAPAPGLEVSIDGRAPVITAGTERLETFRELSAGEHRITVRGPGAGGRIVVRSIPEIFDYPPCADSQVRENGRYDWAFMKRHVLHAVTTLNGGALPGAALPEAKGLGLRWLANFGVGALDDPADVRARMEKHPGMIDPRYDGFTSDELFFGRATIDIYTRALRTLRNPSNRLVYTWIVGKPSLPALHTDFMSACLNASRGRGRLLIEAYCHPQPDERSAADYLDGALDETIRRFSAFFPDAAAGTGVIFGNFNQIPIISLEHDPAVDFKYFLDMQVHRVANNPGFKGLATTGYWGTYYGDEELARWSFLLMRHYAVEGNREMLSARHGLVYRPGHIVNGDFADALKGWTLSPAAEGSIRAETIAGYGKNSQGRWGAGSAGDTVCVMTRQPGAPNRVRQTARGLRAGTAYCLQFVTADLGDLRAKRFNPRRYGIDVTLDGVEPIPGRSFVHIDRRRGGRYAHNANVAKINLHRVVFRAAAPTLDIAFNDGKAVAGEELALNFVQLKPYLE